MQEKPSSLCWYVLNLRERLAMECIMVGLGGAAGAMLRYLIGLLPVGTQGGFPWKTLAINILGSFIIGILTGLILKGALAPRWELLLKTGFCGGFTTFSTFALESQGLIDKGAYGAVAFYMGISLVAGVFAVVAGERLVA
jgi:CrcB protein